MKFIPKKYFFFIIVAALFSAVYFWYWLKLPYTFPLQRELASDFIQLLDQGEYEKSYAMTMRTHYAGINFEAFKERAQREVRGPEHSEYRFAYTYPRQSNGSRLRRYLNGNKVEVNKMSVEFEGRSLLKVEFCHSKNEKWLICKFYSHAG